MGDLFPPEVSVVLLWAWKRQMTGTKVELLQVRMIGREQTKIAESIHKEVIIKIKYRN